MKNNMHKTKLISIFILLVISSTSLLAETVKVDLSKLGHGMLGVDIKGGPYYIIRRSVEETKLLIKKYGKNNLRSGNPNFMLIEATSPDSKCALLHVIKGNKEYSNHPVSLTGGFLDLCSCAWFDLTGRRISSNCPGSDINPAPHVFITDKVVLVGDTARHNKSLKSGTPQSGAP
ncbi:MAG: hypothetical protein KAT25_06565 [Sulfuriflexus sp.]|nr:hypothetical protein [Sulfuriflexus sp.]